MGDVARCSIGKETDYYNEDLLYKLFGVNAELLIDHAWGTNRARLHRSKRIVRRRTVPDQDRYCSVRTRQIKQGLLCRK